MKWAILSDVHANLEALAAKAPVIAIDLPGHGGSTKDVGTGSLTYFADIQPPASNLRISAKLKVLTSQGDRSGYSTGALVVRLSASSCIRTK